MYYAPFLSWTHHRKHCDVLDHSLVHSIMLYAHHIYSLCILYNILYSLPAIAQFAYRFSLLLLPYSSPSTECVVCLYLIERNNRKILSWGHFFFFSSYFPSSRARCRFLDVGFLLFRCDSQRVREGKYEYEILMLFLCAIIFLFISLLCTYRASHLSKQPRGERTGSLQKTLIFIEIDWIVALVN